MQRELIKQSQLLNDRGELVQKGWAKHLLLDYHRAGIKASPWRIKEWDYYCILSESGGISFTISDLGYIGFIAATIFDFTHAKEISNSITTLFPFGKLSLSESSKSGDIIFKNKSLELKFLLRGEQRILEVEWKQFQGREDLSGRIELGQKPSDDSMVIATPFPANPKAFYYNQKINCMPATGEINLGKRKIVFSPETHYGVLDWGRGVWTYANTWYWGSVSGLIEGKRFGLNIGHGFGDTSAATENMVFFDGIAHKLDEVTFQIPEDDFLKPWKFTSNDGRLELDFVPILDRYSNTNMLVIQSWQHQVFGRFSGQVTLDDGTILQIEKLIGFAEKVKNRW